MDIAKALDELRQQREDLDQAILSLERLAAGRQRGRGRPPGRSTRHATKRPAVSINGNDHHEKTASE